MTKAIKIGEWVNVPEFDYEVQVTGRDVGTGELIVAYLLDDGRTAFKTVSRKAATRFVDAA